jgi:hypothetical protein
MSDQASGLKVQKFHCYIAVDFYFSASADLEEKRPMARIRHTVVIPTIFYKFCAFWWRFLFPDAQ